MILVLRWDGLLFVFYFGIDRFNIFWTYVSFEHARIFISNCVIFCRLEYQQYAQGPLPQLPYMYQGAGPNAASVPPPPQYANQMNAAALQYAAVLAAQQQQLYNAAAAMVKVCSVKKHGLNVM